MLHEVELLTKNFFTSSKNEAGDDTVNLLSELSLRLDCSQQSWTALEPLHRVRRALLELTANHLEANGNAVAVAERLRYEIGDSWLRSAELARSCGQFQEAYTLILQVKKHRNVQFFLEASQLAWDRGHKIEAISTLKKGLKEAFPTIQSAWDAGEEEAAKIAGNRLKKEERQVAQRGKLMLAQYLNDSASVPPKIILEHYIQVAFYFYGLARWRFILIPNASSAGCEAGAGYRSNVPICEADGQESAGCARRGGPDAWFWRCYH